MTPKFVECERLRWSEVPGLLAPFRDTLRCHQSLSLPLRRANGARPSRGAEAQVRFHPVSHEVNPHSKFQSTVNISCLASCHLVQVFLTRGHGVLLHHEEDWRNDIQPPWLRYVTLGSATLRYTLKISKPIWSHIISDWNLYFCPKDSIRIPYLIFKLNQWIILQYIYRYILQFVWMAPKCSDIFAGSSEILLDSSR